MAPNKIPLNIGYWNFYGAWSFSQLAGWQPATVIDRRYRSAESEVQGWYNLTGAVIYTTGVQRAWSLTLAS